MKTYIFAIVCIGALLTSCAPPTTEAPPATEAPAATEAPIATEAPVRRPGNVGGCQAVPPHPPGTGS